MDSVVSPGDSAYFEPERLIRHKLLVVLGGCGCGRAFFCLSSLVFSFLLLLLFLFCFIYSCRFSPFLSFSFFLFSSHLSLSMERHVVIGHGLHRATTFLDAATPWSGLTKSAMSPNGSMVAVAYLRDDEEYDNVYDAEVVVMDRDGHTIARLGKGTRPVWSPNSSRLTVRRSGTASELFRVTDNLQFISITKTLPGGADPMWNPGSTKFLTVKYPNLLCVFDMDGFPTRSPVRGDVTTKIVGWSQDGSNFMLHNMFFNVVEVYGDTGGWVAMEGHAQEYWTKNVACWAHDSEHIAMGLSKKQVQVRNINDGTEATFDTRKRFYALCWSPDGSRMAALFIDSVDIMDGRTWERIATLSTRMDESDCGPPVPPEPRWSSDSKRLAVFTADRCTINIYNRDGALLSTITLQNAFQRTRLSSNFMYLFTKDADVKATCLAKWSDRTTKLFNKKFRGTVFNLMQVANRLDKAPRASGPPRLPMEMWLHILSFVV